MPLKATIANAEVMKNTPFTIREGLVINKLTAKTWNFAGKGKSPEEVIFNATVWNPTDEVSSLANGDKIDIAESNFRVDSNPNIVQVRESDLGDEGAKTYPSRFPELVTFGDRVSVTEKADSTRSSRPSSSPEPAESDDRSAPVEDDLPF